MSLKVSTYKEKTMEYDGTEYNPKPPLVESTSEKTKCPWCEETVQKPFFQFGRCPNCQGCVVKVKGRLERDGVFHNSNRMVEER